MDGEVLQVSGIRLDLSNPAASEITLGLPEKTLTGGG
jgi:hypothetical protein